MRKYAIGLATAAIFGAGAFQQAEANDVLIPYIKSGGNWVSLVSFMAESPTYTTNPTTVHFIYWYKKDWDGFTKIADSNTSAADGSYDDAACKEYNDEVPATDNDFTTVDVSISNKLGLTDNVLGKAEGYDGALVGGVPTAPTNSNFVLEPDAIVDAYLYIQNDGTDDNDLHAEAVVFDMVTGMFFYQFGIDVQGTVTLQNSVLLGNPPFPITAGFESADAIVMFQGEDFATTSVYHIPISNSQNAANDLAENGKTGCVVPIKNYNDDTEIRVIDRQEDPKSGLNKICVNCLALIPVKYFMSDSTWNKVKNGGGWFKVEEQDTAGNNSDNAAGPGGVLYKGEVFKIGTKPNIFAPLKTYDNSLQDQ